MADSDNQDWQGRGEMLQTSTLRGRNRQIRSSCGSRNFIAGRIDSAGCATAALFLAEG
jgi:hypothetical protein